MTAKRFLVAISSLSAITTWALVGLRAETGLACPTRGEVVRLEELAEGAGEDSVVGVAHGMLTSVDAGGTSVGIAPAAPGVARHVAWNDGALAYVVDRPGGDLLSVVESGRRTLLEPGGEVTHPSWSPGGALVYAVDLERIEIVDRDGRRESVAAPPGALGIFSPVFDDAGNLVVVVQEAIPGLDGHDDALNNLYRLLPGGGWTRLTSFTADTERWSVIRTPVTDGGRIFFVRQTGNASATVPPEFELWELGPGGATLVRSLPGEAFLASVGDPGIVWNVERGGEWRLVLESPNGFRDLGCGGVMVDPRSESDPDRAPDASVPATEKDGLPSVELGPGMGIVVGDFATRSEAQTVAGALGTDASVIDNGSAPFAVAPGLFAVGIPLPPTSDGLAELDALRDRFPVYRERSWISWIGEIGKA